MTQPQPSPEAMRAAEAIAAWIEKEFNEGFGSPATIEAWAGILDDAFRPLRESHERLKVALKKHGRHLSDCSSFYGGNDTGFDLVIGCCQDVCWRVAVWGVRDLSEMSPYKAKRDD